MNNIVKKLVKAMDLDASSFSSEQVWCCRCILWYIWKRHMQLL